MLEISPRVKRVLDDAASEAERFGSPTVGTEHLLLALVRDADGVAAQILGRLGVAGAVEADIENLHRRSSDDDAFSNHPRPWSSRVLVDEDGAPILGGNGRVQQYFVDSEGRIVTDQQGRRVHVRLSPAGEPFRDEDGQLQIIPID